MRDRLFHAFVLFLHALYSLPYCLADHFEHIILADCISTIYFPKITYLSQMAYYSSTLKPSPDMVAVIQIPWNTTVPWFNATQPLHYSTIFPGGAVFNLTLTNHSSVQDTKAGTGDNGLGQFTCWRDSAKGLYLWDSYAWCDGVYDCNHQDRGGAQALSNATVTTSASTQSTPAPSIPTMPSISGTTGGSIENRDARRSDVIALGLGLGVGLPSTVAAIVGLWYANKQWSLARLLHLRYGSSGDGESTPIQSERARVVERSSPGSGDNETAFYAEEYK